MGGSSTNSYDQKYNSRMADIAERTAEMSEEAFDVWNMGTDGVVGGIGSGRGLEVAQTTAAQELLPAQTDYQKASISAGTQSLGYKSDLMNKFYTQLGQNSEQSAVMGASADATSAITEAKSTASRDAQRRGVSPQAGGYGLEGAKLKAGAITGARETNRQQNLSELAQGLTI